MSATQAGTYTEFVKGVFALAVGLARSEAQVEASSVVILLSNDDEGAYRCECTAPNKTKFTGFVCINTEAQSSSVYVDEIVDFGVRTTYPHLWSRWLLRNGEIRRFD